MRLKDKVAIITGAGRGIGAVTAKKFAAEGAKVTVSDINEKAVKKTAAEIVDMGGEALGLTVDVTNRQQVDNMIAETLKRFGKIDILINNAGIIQDAQLIKMTEEQWDHVINVNLKGAFNVAQAVAKVMKEQQSGVILNASSVVGIFGNFGQTNYAAAKWGINGMTKTWAKELGRYGIRVNAIAPGFIETPMTAKMPDKILNMMKEKSILKKLGRPEDIANGYVFLASDEASYITGTILSIDGGTVL